MGTIYIATNKTNGKQYVGRTVNFRKRKKEHIQLSEAKQPKYFFHKALKKYGKNGFKWICVEYPIEELNEMEMFWIKTLDTKAPNGYNLTDGGDGILNPSSELRNKMASSALSTYQNGRMPWHKNKTMSPNYIKAHSGKIPWNKGKTRIFNDEILQKISEANKGKSKSVTTKKRMSKSKKKWWNLHPNYQRPKEANKKTSYTLNHKLLSKTYILKNIINGEILKINSGFGLFCKENQLDKNKFYEILKGNRKSHKGWIISIEEKNVT